MNISYLDHLVLTVADLEATIDFYTRVLGMQAVTFGEGRKALAFGNQKINTRPGANSSPRPSGRPGFGGPLLHRCHTAGRGDRPPPGAAGRHRRRSVQRTGATGPIRSVYLRDPDQNLIELSNPLENPLEPNA